MSLIKSSDHDSLRLPVLSHRPCFPFHSYMVFSSPITFKTIKFPLVYINWAFNFSRKGIKTGRCLCYILRNSVGRAWDRLPYRLLDMSCLLLLRWYLRNMNELSHSCSVVDQFPTWKAESTLAGKSIVSKWIYKTIPV